MCSTANQGAMELHLFHKLKIDFFHRPGRELGQEPEHMRWVMALWLWFESIEHHNFIHHVATSDAPIIIHFIAEDFASLDRLSNFPGRVDNGLSYTNNVTTEPMDLGYLDIHHKEAVQGVTSFYHNVCRVVSNETEEAPVPSDMHAMLLGGAPIGPNGERISQPQVSPMLLHSAQNPMAPWSPALDPLPEDHISIFIPFSKGLPISKDGIIQFFNSRYGPCVEAVMIEMVLAGQLPLYGSLVLTSAAMILMVLNGKRKANFMIKGRHLWARIYVSN